MSNEYIAQPSQSRFYVPKTLASDFDQFLENDIPGWVSDFEIYEDWYAQYEDEFEPRTIRGEIYPDSTKSRYSNTDNNLNFRASYYSGIKKGDMIVDPEGVIYLLDWEVPPEANNRMSRALRCNVMLTFSRYVKEEVDSRGYLIKEKGWEPVAEAIPCNAYRHDGRLEFSAYSTMPGVVANSVTLISVQFNERTKNIKTDDIFTWGNETYTVVDVNFVGVDIDQTSGVISVQAKRKAGGSL